ncbi:MAG: peptide deformylase [bacterium]
MALLKIARLGNPVLRRRANEVEPLELARPDVQQLIDDMIETMRDAPGVGLAAPQVHRSMRLFVMDPGEDDDGRSQLRVVVNPELTFPSDEKMRLWEGCLSIPGLRGETERWAAVDVDYLDREGRPTRLSLQGYPAAIVQHETDHLDGVLFLARMPDPLEIAFEEEFSRWVRTDDEAEFEESL